MIERLRARPEWAFFVELPRADRWLAWIWWGVVLLHGLLPTLFAVAIGVLVSAVEQEASLTPPLALVGVLFVALQVVTPIQTAVSHNLGDRVAARLYDRLTAACLTPSGMAHLEDPDLAADLTTARDFDLGMTGPPLSYSLDFIAGGLVGLLGGVSAAAVLAGLRWWAPLVLGGAWASTHWLLRESGVWRDRQTSDVRRAQHEAEYLYRLAVDPPASKELRLFGLVGWTIARFLERRTRLHALQYEATRLRERPMLWSLLIVTVANLAVFIALAQAGQSGRITFGQLVIFAQCAVGTSLIAFGGLNWALDGAAAPVAAVARLERAMREKGHLTAGARSAAGLPAHDVRFNGVTFAYRGGPPVLDDFSLTIPAGTSLAIVGVNGAGKTTIAKLLCRLYDPAAGTIEIDGIDLRQLDVASWRSRIAAVFQDFVRFHWPLRRNVAPAGSDDDTRVARALADAGATHVAALDAILARGYDGGVDLSGGQWQRIALARALNAVDAGAGLVLLDEPTAQLDVRGEAEIFERLLRATRRCTTILISHRFSTVRLADRICVLERGRVVELGSHDELMALGGRYRTMFDLQAQRFVGEDEEGRRYESLA